MKAILEPDKTVLLSVYQSDQLTCTSIKRWVGSKEYRFSSSVIITVYLYVYLMNLVTLSIFTVI